MSLYYSLPKQIVFFLKTNLTFISRFCHVWTTVVDIAWRFSKVTTSAVYHINYELVMLNLTRNTGNYCILKNICIAWLFDTNATFHFVNFVMKNNYIHFKANMCQNKRNKSPEPCLVIFHWSHVESGDNFCNQPSNCHAKQTFLHIAYIFFISI